MNCEKGLRVIKTCVKIKLQIYDNMLQARTILLNWAQVVKNGDRFEGDFLDRQPHGNVVYVRNPSNDDISDDGEQVN